MAEPRWEFFPLLAEQEQPGKWLQVQADLGGATQKSWIDKKW